MASWKTTTTGVVLVVAAVVGMVTGHVDRAVGLMLITAGLGLIAARDNGVTSEQAGAKPPPGEIPPTTVVAAATPMPAPGPERLP